MEQAIIEFDKYTEPYLNLHHVMQLKVDHTMRVKTLCEQISRSLNLSDEDIELSSLIGLLHDIGRFEQWKRYASFNDTKTIDHATLGVEILKQDNLIRKYVKESDNDELILSSIEYHNKYKVPDNLNDREKMFANIIRNADKLDILYLCSIGEIKNKTENQKFSEKILRTLKNKKTVNLLDKITKGDSFAIVLGFVFDLNFKESFKILKENKYVDKMIDIQKEYNNNQEFHEQLEDMRLFINKYIEEMIQC